MDKLADYLIEKETITGKEFMQIFRKEKGIPEPVEEEKPGSSEESEEKAEAEQAETEQTEAEKTENVQSEGSADGIPPIETPLDSQDVGIFSNRTL